MNVISIDSFKNSLSDDGKKILGECDKYIDAMRQCTDSAPTQLCLARNHYKNLQSAINGLTKKKKYGYVHKSRTTKTI